MVEHTPGPWIAETNEKSASVNILGRHGDEMRCRSSDRYGSIVIVECWQDGHDEPFAPMLSEQLANARLIAAAPDLKQALAAMLDLWGGYECPEVDAAITVMQSLGEDRWSMQAQMDAALSTTPDTAS